MAERMRLARCFTPHYAERDRPSGQILAVRGEPLPHNGFVTLYTDITATRRYEQQIERQNIELEKRVAERTSELQATNQRLIEADDANQRIASALRRSEENLRLITDSVPALIGYFDHQEIYRYVNKGYADWFGASKEAVLGRSVHQVVGDEIYTDIAHHVQLALKGQRVSYEYAMPDGGRLAMGVARIELGLAQAADFDVSPGCYVALSVSDTGTGMDAATQARALEPFFTTKRFGSGSGLGLSMVYGFAKQSGGGIRIQSALGEGCVVTLVLPCTDALEVEPPLVARHRSGRQGADRALVLLVEDYPDVRRVIRLQLVGLGYPVIEADHAADALSLTTRRLPCVACCRSVLLTFALSIWACLTPMAWTWCASSRRVTPAVSWC